uniref:Uncharacterized protein n=1 Tax=Stegastes partitus TaxID=144197 RepID=A0A3B5A7G5_9TELE
MLVLSEASVKASSSVSFLPEDLRCRLQQLQCCFTWGLKEEDLQLDDLSRQLQHDIDLQLGQRGAVRVLRYLQGRPQEALTLLSQSEDRTRKCFGEDSERRLIVTYGDMAWIQYHNGDYEEVQHPCGSSAELHAEVLGEKGWTLLKFSKSLYQEAGQCFQRALQLQPDSWEWNAGYAIALFRTEPSLSPATKQLRRAVKFCPDDGVLMSMLALKLVHQHKHREAEVLVERVLAVGPDDDDQVIRYVAKYLRIQVVFRQHLEFIRNKDDITVCFSSAFFHCTHTHTHTYN